MNLPGPGAMPGATGAASAGPVVATAHRGARALVSTALRAVGAVVEAVRGIRSELRSETAHGNVGSGTPVPLTAEVAYENKFSRSVFLLFGTAVSVAVAVTWSDALHNLANCTSIDVDGARWRPR